MRLLNTTSSVIREGFVVQTPLSASWVCKGGVEWFAHKPSKQTSLIVTGWFPPCRGKKECCKSVVLLCSAWVRVCVGGHSLAACNVEARRMGQLHCSGTEVPGCHYVGPNASAFSDTVEEIPWHEAEITNVLHLLFYFHLSLVCTGTSHRCLGICCSIQELIFAKRWLMNMRFQGRSLSVT